MCFEAQNGEIVKSLPSHLWCQTTLVWCADVGSGGMFCIICDLGGLFKCVAL